MQFSSIQAILTIAALAVFSNGNPVSDSTFVGMTDAQMDAWIATTTANITYMNDVGAITNTPTPRAALATRVVYCNRATGPICGGDCTVYNGGNACLWAHTTQCISATNNVAFCDRDGCGGSCNWFNSCGTRMDNGFCYTPGTRSINVPFT